MISHFPRSERPRERCLRLGANVLSLREALAVLLNSGPPGKGCLGLARDILDRTGPGLSESDQERSFFCDLESQGLGALAQVKGLGPSARARLLVSFDLALRYAKHLSEKGEKRSKSKKSLRSLREQAIRKIPSEYRLAPWEWLGFVPVYDPMRLGGLCIVAKGVRTHVHSDPCEFFSRLLPLKPRAFFLFHNHPSGDPTPSAADMELTRKICDLAEPFGIFLLGHGVIAVKRNSWIDGSS